MPRPQLGALACALITALAVVPDTALADDGISVRPMAALSRGRKIRGVGTAAVIDGSWALALHINSNLTVRAWDAPYPWGTIGHYSTRILYGTSWTVMLGLEALIVSVASGGSADWVAEGAYRSDWMMPVDSPTCTSVGASGGCGLGVGGFSFIQVRPIRTRWWFEAGGGWIQQRVLNDANRTVAESSWVLTPISAVYELRTDPSGPVSVQMFAGPGVYFGMHAGHMHPTTGGRKIYSDAPWTQMYPMTLGIGPGARVETRVVVARHLSLEGEVLVAPFLLGDQYTVPRDVAPLTTERGGIPVWRKVTAGIGWEDRKTLPFKATLEFFAAELSARPIDQAGYRGGMIRFDIPLELSAP